MVGVSLEAAIGIEPMNKGFAARLRHLSPSVMECHSRINIGVLRIGNTQYQRRVPTKVPTVEFIKLLAISSQFEEKTQQPSEVSVLHKSVCNSRKKLLERQRREM